MSILDRLLKRRGDVECREKWPGVCLCREQLETENHFIYVPGHAKGGGVQSIVEDDCYAEIFLGVPVDAMGVRRCSAPA